MTGPLITLAAYLIGSVCFGPILAARSGVDLRSVGSGNIGATNVARAMGSSAGRWVMGLDLLKGALPVVVAQLILGRGDPWTAAAGAAAVAGHILPPWHRFRGGKGAATGCGALLALVPPAGATALLAFLVVKKSTGRASAGSLVGALLGLGVTIALHGTGPATIMAAAIVIMVVARHAANIQRLVQGTEPRE